MFRACADASALECIALKATTIIPALLLQKPHPRSREKDHTIHLDRHLQLWKEGIFETLLFLYFNTYLPVYKSCTAYNNIMLVKKKNK